MHLREMADLWTSRSDGRVKVAIIISIEKLRPRILVEKWTPDPAPQRTGPSFRNRGQSAVREQHVSITKRQDGSAAVSGAPLAIRFQEMFLRNPTPPTECDSVPSEEDLGGIAQDVWEVIE